MPCHREFARIFELVPELGSDDARENNKGDDIEGVGVDSVALEVFVEDDGSDNRGEPEEKTESSDRVRAKVDIWIHAVSSV